MKRVGACTFLRFFIPGFRSYPRIKQSRIPTRYGVAYFPMCLYSIEAFKRMYFITYPVVGIHRNLVLTGADCQSPECQEQNVKVNAFPISVILYPKLFYERVLKSMRFFTKKKNYTLIPQHYNLTLFISS